MHDGPGGLYKTLRARSARPLASVIMRRIVSWNVNGIRACVARGFVDWLRRCGADVIGLQEMRVTDELLPANLRRSKRYPHFFLSAARSRLGYSGVGLFSREAPREIVTDLGRPRFDREGRFQLVRFDDLLVANVYFPNGNGKERDLSRVPYKLAFTRRVFDVVDEARARTGLPALVLGDYNTAPAAIDLARPRANEKNSGFLPAERRALARCIERGYVDTFRALFPEEVRYSWWSSRFGVREKNIGWRIDLVLASADLMPRVRSAFIWDHVPGSDHCPVGVDISEGGPPPRRGRGEAAPAPLVRSPSARPRAARAEKTPRS